MKYSIYFQIRMVVLPALFLLAGYGGGRDIYVSLNGTNNPPYTNWPSAATNIEWAVNVGVNGDTVWISNGVYVLTNQVTVNSNITICGTGGTVVVDGNNANRCFEFAAGTIGTLANLFITRGYATNNGGGVYMRSGTVRDCIFSNNICTNRGGGLFMESSCQSIARGLTFIENKAYIGGGLYLYYPNTTVVDNCFFKTNTAGYRGGGMYAAGDYWTITGCEFICNVSTNHAGGLFLSCNQRCLVTHCNIVSNVAMLSAYGGIYVGGTGLIASNLFISNNIAFTEGGISISGSQVKNSVIARNATTSGTSGGGGGVYIAYSGWIQDSIIEENQSAFAGGGVLFGNYGGTVRNCLIRNNTVSGTNGQGGGVKFYHRTNVVISCTIVSNYASVKGGGIYNGLGADETGAVENCIIYFNQSGDGVYSNYYNISTNSCWSNNCFSPAMGAAYTSYSANNITSDPLFIDRTGGNYRLKGNSPCINAGVNRNWMTNSFDLDNRIRIRYGIVDMGAYEAIYNGTIYGFH